MQQLRQTVHNVKKWEAICVGFFEEDEINQHNDGKQDICLKHNRNKPTVALKALHCRNVTALKSL